MTRNRRLLLGGAIGAVALLAVLGTVLLATFDPNRYKGAAVDYLQAHYQRRLVLDGPISLHLFPRLAVSVERVSLSEPNQPELAFLRLDAARLSVAVLPLLRKQLVVDRVEASGLSLRYRRDEQGHRNFDDLLAPQPQTPAATPDGRPAQPMQLDISAIELHQLALDVDDRKLPARGQLLLTQFSSGRLAPGETAPVKLIAQANFTQPAAQVTLEGSLQLRLDLGDAQRAMHADARELALRLQGTLPGLPRIDARLGGTLGWDGTAGALQAEGLAFAAEADLGALALHDTRLTLARLRYAPAQQTLVLDQLRLDVKGERRPSGAAAQPLHASLQWPALNIQGDRLSGSPLAGTFGLEGPAAVQGRIESGAPAGRFEQFAVPAFRLVLGGASGATRITGTVQADLGIAPPAKALTLTALALDTRVQHPSLRAIALRATGDASASPTAAHWRLAGTTNDQAFRTDGDVALGGARPQVQAQATFGELDLDALLPPPAPPSPASRPSKAPTAATTAGQPGAPADTPVDLSTLTHLDGRFTLQAGTVRKAPYVLHNVKAVATLDNGRLDLNPLSLDTWDGHLAGRVQADANGAQSVAAVLRAERIDMAQALRDVARSDLLEGRGALSLDLRSSGRSVQAMKSALAGDAKVQLRDGAVRGFNLAKAVRQFQAALSMQQDAVSQARQTEKTDFSEFSASFRFDRGIGTNRDLDVKSPLLRIGGEGTVNLPTSRLDYTVRAAVTNTTKGQGGADVASLYGVTVPVQLEGPFDAVNWRIRWSQVVAGAAGNTVKRQLGDKLREELRGQLGVSAASDAASQPSDAELRQKAREKLKDQLKGLLR